MRLKNKFTVLDGLLLLASTIAGTFVVYRLFWGMNYNWNWQAVLPYIYYIDPETGEGSSSVLIEGLLTTIRISIWAMIIAIIIGFITGIMRTSPRLFLRLTGTTYIALIRNTPPLVLIFIFYYFISDQFFSFLPVDDFINGLSESSIIFLQFVFTSPENLIPFLSGIITLALFQGAYIGEIVRAGIEAVDRGQWEASAALGLSRPKQLQRIILPQAIRTMLPALAGEFINTIKWSSIVAIISIQELTFQGMQVMASTQASLEVWIIISIMYLLICFSLSTVIKYFEHKFSSSSRINGLNL
ncbi:MAG: amino acid ABC transporter permease [Desulfotalea sp.]